MFHNGSNDDFHLIINQLAKDFDGPFNCLGENTENYITFSICILKKTCPNKNSVAHQIKFIDSYRHMSQSLSNLVDNLAQLSKNLPANASIKRFHNTYQLSDNNIEKFKILLRKGIYPYEYMNSWKRFNEPVPLSKKYYYSELNDENISDSDLVLVKNVCHIFNITNLVDYHYLYVSLDVALLVDVFKKFRDISINIDQLDPAYYLSAPRLYWQSCLKKTVVKLELLTDENKWETDLSIFTEDFIKNYSEESDTGYLFYVNITYPKNLYKLHRDLPFLSHRMKVNKVNKLVIKIFLYDKNNYSIHFLH